MAPRDSASAAPAKRKSYSDDKQANGDRPKKFTKSANETKRPKFDDNEDAAADNEGRAPNRMRNVKPLEGSQCFAILCENDFD
jgi:hypothetical protein